MRWISRGGDVRGSTTELVDRFSTVRDPARELRRYHPIFELIDGDVVESVKSTRLVSNAEFLEAVGLSALWSYAAFGW